MCVGVINNGQVYRFSLGSDKWRLLMIDDDCEQLSCMYVQLICSISPKDPEKSKEATKFEHKIQITSHW